MQPKASPEEWRSRIERWRGSGLTAEKFAAEVGLNAGTLKFWAYKLNKAKREASGEVAPSKKMRTAAASSFVEVRTASESCFEIELENGRRLRVPTGFEAKALERLLGLLERK